MNKMFILLLVLLGCGERKRIPIPTKTETSAIEKGYAFRWDNARYDKILVAALKKSNLANYTPLDHAEFGKITDHIKWYGNIMVEMSYFESKWNPSVKYKEASGTWSRGLFQVSRVDGKRYGCDFTTERSVHNERANIECAVLIMEKLIGQDKRLAGKVRGRWTGGSRYWSVLRGTRTYTAKALRAIKNANK